MNPPATDHASNALLFWIDPEGRILDASDEACRALGYDRETLRAMSVRDVDAEFPFERWPDHWRELRQAKTLHFRTTHRRRDGSPVPVEVTAHHVELDGREYNCALVREITPQPRPETALRESEERLALALEVSGQGLYDLDIATGRTVFSDEYARMLGHEPSELELTPATWASWLHPEDRERLLRLFEECVTGKRSDYRAEFRLRTRCGDWIWVLSVGKIVRWNATGRPARMIGTHMDITERKRTEAALRESEERFAKAFRASPAPMALSDIETGRLLDVNEQVLAMLNYTREEMIGRTSTELGVWADPGTRERLIARFRADGFFREIPVRFRTKTGQIREVLFSAERIRVGAGDVMLSLIYDITERQRAEMALRASEAFLDSIIAQSPLPIVVYDAAGAIVRFNRATRDLFRVTDERAADQYNLFRDEQLREQGYLPLLERVFQFGETIRFQSRYDPLHAQFPAQSHPACYLDLDSTTFPIRDADGHVTHAVTYHFDITDRKAAETRLRYHLDLEQALAEISALMIKPGWGDFDARVNWTLERIGRLTGADRSFLFLTAPDGLVASNTHEWCAPGIRSQIQDLQNLPVADYQPFYGLLQQQEVVKIQTARLPDDIAFKPILLEGGVRSLLCVSANWGGKPQGFVGFDAVTTERAWREEDVRLLRMVAEIVAHTLQHIESERILRDNARYLENLDRISRILARRERDADLLAELAATLLEIFQADRVFFLYPCDPDAATFHIRFEATRPEWPGVFASGAEITPDGVEIVPDDAFRRDLRQTFRRRGPMLSDFAGMSEAPNLARRSGIRSQMTITLRPQFGQPWVLGVHQCAHDRRWTDAEQQLFQAIAERVSDALSGHLLLKQLQESEQRYRTVFENAHDAIIVHDFQGAIRAVNQTMLTLFGLDYEEALTANIADLSGPDNPSNPADDHWPRISRGETLRFEWNARRPKDGSCFPVEVMLRAIQIGGENCILANARDITERQRAETALRASEERFAKAFRSSPAAIVISTLDEGRFIDVNDRWLDMMGYAREEMIGRTSKGIGLWTDVEVRDRAVVEIGKTGAFRDIPARIRTKAGEEREELWSAETITLDGQQVLLSHIYDITERKRAEEALQKTANEMQWLMKSMANAFVMWESVFDADGQFINFRFAYFNDAYEKVSGLKLEEVQGKTVLEVWPETEQSWFDVYGEVAITGNPKYFEMYHAPTRGLYACNAYRPWDTPDRICVVFEDVTERKRAEEELQRHREHLEELVAERTAELHQAMTQLVQAEKLAALGHLVAGVAHELNTPLGNARTVASALGEHLHEFAAAAEAGGLRRSQLDAFLERGREAVDLLERNTARAADLIGHFKQVAVDQTSVRRRRFPLRQTIEELLATLQPQFKRTAHRVELDILPDIELDSYPGPLEQVIANLVGNSLAHGFAGIEAGVIRIRAAPLGTTQIKIDYADNGVGIPETILKRIFEPFFTTKLGQGGSGLGLYIAYNLITGVLGGAVQVGSAPDHGTTFTLTLPRTAPDRTASD